MKKKLLFLLIIVVILFLTTGCTAEALRAPIDPANGVWDKFFVYPISQVLDFFARLFAGNYGFSIIVTTIIIRLLLLPLMMKQIQSTKIMNKIRPELDKLREKYKDDKNKMNEEYMKMLKENNANPFAGCFPIIINMVVLIALYHAIIRDTAIKTTTFLTIPLGEPSILLPVLAALATFLQTKTAKTVAATPQAETQQKIMLYFLPIMILFIGLQLPAALALYWVVGNTFGILQNLVVYRDIEMPVIRNAKGNIQKKDKFLFGFVPKENRPKASPKSAATKKGAPQKTNPGKANKPKGKK